MRSALRAAYLTTYIRMLMVHAPLDEALARLAAMVNATAANGTDANATETNPTNATAPAAEGSAGGEAAAPAASP